MERVAFLIENTNERITCLLNPETLLIQRIAGVRSRTTLSSGWNKSSANDDAVFFTGGGKTELELSLLFDVYLENTKTPKEDVRDLTGPFWRLTENQDNPIGIAHPPYVRFIWGRSWNILCVITAIAERLEEFSTTGAPLRSWVKIRLLRVPDRATTTPTATAVASSIVSPSEIPFTSNIPSALIQDNAPTNATETTAHEMKIGERLDEIAYRYYGNSALWRVIAIANNLADPTNIPAGKILNIPPLKNTGA